MLFRVIFKVLYYADNLRFTPQDNKLTLVRIACLPTRFLLPRCSWHSSNPGEKASFSQDSEQLWAGSVYLVTVMVNYIFLLHYKNVSYVLKFIIYTNSPLFWQPAVIFKFLLISCHATRTCSQLKDFNRVEIYNHSLSS
jgi:hypothetical protein